MEKKKLYVCTREHAISRPIAQRIERGHMVLTAGPCPPHYRPWQEGDGEPQPGQYHEE